MSTRNNATRKPTPRPRFVINNARRIQRRIRSSVKTVRKSVPGFDLNNAASDLFSTIQRVLYNPVVLLSILACTALVVTHSTTFGDGFVGKWVQNNKDNTVAKWVGDNNEKFLGLIIFLPTIVASPKKIQVLLAAATILWVMLVPESTNFQYLIQSAAMFLYFKVKSQTRVLIVISVCVLYYMGIFFKTTPP